MNEKIKKMIEDFKLEAGKRIIGQENLICDILTAFVAGGHILLEGAPGLAKTLAVKTVAEILGLEFKRIQFTPDLLPADITGTLIYEQNKGVFSARKGPIFSNIILADEINRAPAKVQSAMLEAMEERRVTIGDETFNLPEPFFALATQNPIEQEGTYNLPEAELDRFLMKVVVDYPNPNDEVKIVASCGKAPFIPVKRILSADDLKLLQQTCENVNCDEKILKYGVSILNVTRPQSGKKSGGIGGIGSIGDGGISVRENRNFASLGSKSNDVTRYIQVGASPRAGIAMVQCAKANAMFEGRDFVLPDDVQKVARSVLRHRMVLSYEAAADNVSADEIILNILDFIPIP